MREIPGAGDPHLTTEAPTNRCARCGASAPVDPVMWTTRCAHCHTETRVDPALREQARDYAEGLRQQQLRIEIAHRQQQHYDGSGGGILGALGLATSAEVPKIDAVTSAPCAACGAAIVFRIGQTVARCAHCGATAYASVQVAAQMVAVVEAHAILAESSTARAERVVLRRGLGVTGGPGPMAWLSGVAMGGFSFVGFGLMSLVLDDDGGAGAAGLIGIGGAALVGGAIAYLKLTKKPRAVLRELRVIAARMNARVENRGLLPVFAWLDAYWIGENPDNVRAAEAGGRCWVIAGSWRGAPALIVVTSTDSRIDLFIARRNHTAPPNTDARRALEEAGFKVRAGPGGAHATMRTRFVSVLGNGGVERLFEALWAS